MGSWSWLCDARQCSVQDIATLQVFLDVDATLIEMNPFTLDPSGEPFPLDIRVSAGKGKSCTAPKCAA